jgi:hypothetical protein
MNNLIRLKPPFSGKNDFLLKDNIKNGKYEHIGRGSNYSNGPIDLIEKMMNRV